MSTARGFDFAYAIRAFLDPARIVGHDRRWDYGEDRYRLLGAIEGRVFVLIYAMRGAAIRIISAREANRREVREYDDPQLGAGKRCPTGPAKALLRVLDKAPEAALRVLT